MKTVSARNNLLLWWDLTVAILNLINSQCRRYSWNSSKIIRKNRKIQKKSDEMARIPEVFRQFHKFRMENSEKLSDDVRKMAFDYVKLLEVLEEDLSTNENMMQLLEKQ